MEEREWLGDIRRRLTFWGFVIALVYAYGINMLMELLIYRFDSGTVLLGVYSFLINGVVVLPLALLILWFRFTPIIEAIQGYQNGHEEERPQKAWEIMRECERYPLQLSIIGALIAAYLFVAVGSTFITFDRLSPPIVINFIIMGLAVSTAMGFLEFFVLHSILHPVRKNYYPLLRAEERLKGVTIRSRIIALVIFLAAFPVLLSVTTAVVRNAMTAQELLLGEGEEYAGWMAEIYARQRETGYQATVLDEMSRRSNHFRWYGRGPASLRQTLSRKDG